MTNVISISAITAKQMHSFIHELWGTHFLFGIFKALIGFLRITYVIKNEKWRFGTRKSHKRCCWNACLDILSAWTYTKWRAQLLYV